MSLSEENETIPQHLLGYRADPKWRDMSNFLVHFTDSVQNLAAILVEGQIRAGGPHGWGRKFDEVTEGHRSCCLSEIPLDQLDRLRNRHGRYGIGFTRSFVRQAGGTRVWYLDQGTPAANALFEEIRKLLQAQDFGNRLWKLTPFIDPVMPSRRHEWDWEREWRIPGGLTFDLTDVAFVMLPHGETNVIEEEVRLDAPLLDPDDPEDFWRVVADTLADNIDSMVAEFLENYIDPIEELPWDEGEYVWLVTRYETEDAVQTLFGDLVPEIASQLCDDLNQLSTVWANRSELREMHDDADYF